ncbi:MAG: ABC transporter permease [Bdellovibrionales bacterium]|nr:ABC transporter permease [Bdellovibrionales bacterium]
MAIRNLRRNFRRSIITISSISLGLALIFWMQAVLEGQNYNVVAAITAAHLGHLQIQRKDFALNRQPDQYFTPAMAGNFEKHLPPGSSFSERIYLPVLLSTSEGTTLVQLEGIDPVRERKTSTLADIIKEGEFLKPETKPDCDSRQLIVSKMTAKSLGVGLGMKMVTMTQATDGTLGNELLRVSGTFETGAVEFDRSVALTTRECAQKIAVMNGVHEIAILLPNDTHTLEIQKKIAEGLDPSLQITNWGEALPRMLTVLRYNSSMLVMVSAMTFIVMTLGILNTILVSVVERTREFGLMTSLGTKSNVVIFLVMTETLMTGAISVVIGTALGWSVVLYHQINGFDATWFLGRAPMVGMFKLSTISTPILNLAGYFKLVAASFGFVTLAGLYPALKASRMKPIEAMRV